MNWELVNTIVGIVQIIVSIVLVASVLMQSAKKEGVPGIVGGASETFFGKNKSRTLDSIFSAITTVCAIIFLVSSLFLSYGMIAVDKANNPQQVEQQQEQQIQVTFDEEGNVVDAATGEILLTAEEAAKQGLTPEALAEADTEAEETPAE